MQEGNSFISLSAAGDPLVTASHFLVEYCHVERVVDFGNLYGTNHIVRNNWSHDMRDEYWTAVGHPDFAQPGSEQTQNGARHHVYERNFVGDSPTEHSHFGIWQDYQIDYGDTNHLIRGNVGYQIGGGGIGNIGTDKWQTYHNTFHEINGQNNGHVISWARDLSQNAGSVGGVAINSIIADDGIATDGNAIFVENDNFVRLTNNWGYLAGSEPSYLGTTDPKFVDPSNQDFRLQSDSPVINLGTYVTTITTADGSGTTFDVADSHIFYDGWGRVEGDLITTGGTTVRITGMTNLTVFVSASVSWTNGQPIYWGTDTTPDLGAYPYGIAFLTSATMLRSGTTYTVTPVGDARGVWFYVDGIPTTWDYEAPFQTTVASGTVTAKAYALYAQTWPVVNATDLGESGSSPYRNKGRASRAGGVIP